MSSSRSARMRSDSYSHPRIRRLSRRELEEIFPTNNQPRSSIKSFPSNQTSKQYLTNLNSCRISSDQAKLSFDQRLEQEQINARSKSKARQSKQAFRIWCLTLSILVGSIILSVIITTILLLLLKPTTTTSTTRATATIIRSTSATTFTSTSTSSSSSTSSTTSTTSTSTASTTSSTSETTSTTSTSISTSSSTSTTSTTSTSTTSRNPQLARFNDSTLVEDIWTYQSYLISSTSSSLTLQYVLTLDNKHDWYLHDISVKDSSLNEIIINGNFEGSTLNGWTTGTCSINPGLSNVRAKASAQSYRNQCQRQSISLTQSFNSTIGQSYNISFWFFLDKLNNGAGVGSNELAVNLI